MNEKIAEAAVITLWICAYFLLLPAEYALLASAGLLVFSAVYLMILKKQKKYGD
jgi:hypothetical protein